MIKKQYTLYLENKPGALAKMARQLAKVKVNIEGISVAETTDVGLVQIVVDKSAVAQRELKRAKIPFTEQNVTVLTLPNRPGALATVTARLAKAGINVNYLYSTACSACAGECTVVISGDDLARIEKMWK